MGRLIDLDAIPENAYWCRDALAEALADAPTVEERKTGKWVHVDEQPYFKKHFHDVCCSECHRKGNKNWNFCPNCGASMMEGEQP